MAKVYALSLKQPWATLVATGLKSIEVRSWPTRIRGRVLIHAARIPDNRPEAWKWVTEEVRPLTQMRGGIIGEAVLKDCVAYPDEEGFSTDGSRHLNDPTWFQKRGLYGFVFSQAAPLPFRTWTGNVRFFTVEEQP